MSTRGSQPPQEILEKIQNLTQDEDHRQDLWVMYLEGSSAFSVDDDRCLSSVAVENLTFELLQYSLIQLPQQDTIDFIGKFSPIEQTFMIMLMLGFTKDQISQYKMVKLAHLNQMFNTIANSPHWENFFEKAPNLKGAERAYRRTRKGG